jgi:curved DNA-binding protein CbpA
MDPAATVKSYYELLGIDVSADLETIKKAFRREIARYHPDKVAHLGREFQEMASHRAMELTTAYTTLTNPGTRAEYDVSLANGASARAKASQSSARHDVRPYEPVQARAQTSSTHTAAPSAGRAEPDRWGRDDIVRRATLGRLREVVRNVMGDCDTRAVKGFDSVFLSKVRPSLLRRTTPPSLLVKFAPIVDSALVTEAWTNAVRANLEHKPLVLLLVGDTLAPAYELSRAIEDLRRRNPSLVNTLFAVPVDVRDWSAKIPSNAPDAVRALIEKLKTFSGAER